MAPDIEYMLETGEQEQLAGFLQLPVSPILAVEIGSWKGCSTKVITQQVAKTGGLLYCVDDWKGSGNADTLDTANREDVFNVFRDNMKELNHWCNIRVLMMTSLEAARIFQDGIVDFIFLDADHSYEHVKEDILMWLPKLKLHGIFTGHDLDHSGVKRAVDEIFGNVYVQIPHSRIWYYKKEVHYAC